MCREVRAPRPCHFNSRPSARGDDGRGRPHCTAARISIHAPPRGATTFNRILGGAQPFQFTPLREGRPRPAFSEVRAVSFQFTPLREGRPETAERRREQCLFQFTPLREGRRRSRLFISPAPMYFNSRPSARGDRPEQRLYIDSIEISIHAPPRGATDGSSPRTAHLQHFNSRPSARGDGNPKHKRNQD